MMNANIFLFSATSTTVDSDFFTILPGHVALITAHGLQPGTHPGATEEDFHERRGIIVEKASIPPNDMHIQGVKTSIEGMTIVARDVAKYVTPVITDCGWRMHACNNLVAITVPGVYRLRLTEEAMLGDVTVDVTTVTIKQASEMPDSIKLGN